MTLGLFVGALAILSYQLLRPVLSRGIYHLTAARTKAGEPEVHQALLSDGPAIHERRRYAREYVALDGARHEFADLADFIVAHDGEEALVEIRAIRPEMSPALPATTRRQLREQCALFGVRSVLLIDPDRHTRQMVTFPVLRTPQIRQRAWSWCCFYGGLAVGTGALLMLS